MPPSVTVSVRVFMSVGMSAGCCLFIVTTTTTITTTAAAAASQPADNLQNLRVDVWLLCLQLCNESVGGAAVGVVNNTRRNNRRGRGGRDGTSRRGRSRCGRSERRRRNERIEICREHVVERGVTNRRRRGG